MLKKIIILNLFIFTICQIMTPAETLYYSIKQEGSSVVIVPYYTKPAKQLLYTPPAKIPFYINKKLPKGVNKNRLVLIGNYHFVKII